MFQLKLGQDVSNFLILIVIQNGPFKLKEVNGCPQIDKFATYSLNAIVNNNKSPRIGILGQSTFPSEADFFQQDKAQLSQYGSQFASGKIDDVSSSVNKQIKVLEDQLVTGYDMLQLFKEEADHIRKEIDVMMNVLIEKTEVVQDELHQDTRKDYKRLKANIKAQRDENEMLYKDLKQITKDTES